MVSIVAADPAVDTVVGFTGGSGATNTARMFISLKPLDRAQGVTADHVIARLRPQAGPRARRHPVPAGRAGPARRRAA